MALYTGKGDDGTTYVFDSGKGERIPKASGLIEALGACDELGSYLGLCKIEARTWNYSLNDGKKFWYLHEIVHELQEDLFTIQAELAGADKKIRKSKVKKLERWIKLMDEVLPEIKTFFIPGGTELSSRFDYARTLARQAERRIVYVHTEEGRKVGKQTLAYINRLSSVLYALARFSNHLYGAGEVAPSYR